MRKKQERLYIAYGSNLNLGQMAKRCPTARIVGSGLLRGWRLMFRGRQDSAVATVERAGGSTVPVLVWRLHPLDERALDRYEAYPTLYRKETLRLTVNGKRIYAMIYIMNEDGHPYGTPSAYYLNTIYSGYKSAGFDTQILCQAVINSQEESQEAGASVTKYSVDHLGC